MIRSGNATSARLRASLPQQRSMLKREPLPRRARRALKCVRCPQLRVAPRPHTGAARQRARVSALLKRNVSDPFFHRLMIDQLVTLNTPAAVKDFDQRAISARYREFIRYPLLDGLKAR